MRRRAAAAVLGGALAAGLVVAGLTTGIASAARLEVTAAPIQTWKVVDGLPDLPTPAPQVDLSACGDPAEYDEIVYGTPGPDILEAGNGRQILVGLAGDDVLRGGNHDDCLLGGDGDDELYGGNGRDVLVGGAGADELDGGTGQDHLDAGGDAGDSCVSEGAPDVLVGCPSGDVADEGLRAPAAQDESASDSDLGPDDGRGEDKDAHEPTHPAGGGDRPRSPEPGGSDDDASSRTPTAPAAGAVEVAEEKASGPASGTGATGE